MSLEKMQQSIAQLDMDQAYELGVALSQQENVAPVVFDQLAAICALLGRFEEALPYFEQALRHTPDSTSLHTNYASALLGAERWQQGWQELLWRWKEPRFTQRFHAPLWDGHTRVQSLLVWGDYALGDQLQFARFLPAVAAQVDKLWVMSKAPLWPLFEALGAQALQHDMSEVIVQAQAPLLALPHLLGIKTPEAPPYLKIPAAYRRKWAKKISPGPLTVGLVWAGATYPNTPWMTALKLRSLHLSTLAPVLALPDIRWCSLQLGPAASQRQDFDHLPWLDHTAELHDLADTAALIEQLDVVISIDTAVAHLAGGLGTPVWMLLGHRPVDWRWGSHGHCTRWFHNMRLYRQSDPHWHGTLQQLCLDLNLLKSTLESR